MPASGATPDPGAEDVAGFTFAPVGRRVNSSLKNPVVERRRSLETQVRYHTHDIHSDYDLGPDCSVIGSGYSGPVLMATSKSFGHGGQRYAVKTFHKTDLCPKKLAFLKAEVNIYLKLDHPYITRLLEVYENEHSLYLVMEYCGGGELYHRLAAKKTFTESVAAETTSQMLLSIGYLHNNNVVHRDLKLENWLYETEEQDSKLKLIDFGFSKVFDKHTKMHQSCGSVAYVAPEVLRRSYSGGNCDMWSLGVIVFMLLSGYPPFYGRTEEKMILLIEQGRYHMRNERWDRISESAKDFVRKLLEMDENRRLTADQALRHPWIRASLHPDRGLNNNASCLLTGESMIQGLRQYALASHLKRAVLCTIAFTLDSSEIADVRELFLSLDKSQSGTISLVDFRDAMKGSDLAISTEEIRRTFHCLDHACHGCIEYSQFVAAFLQCSEKIHSQQFDGLVRDAFDKFDTDHTGFLTAKNLEEVLGEKFENTPVREIMKETTESCSGGGLGRTTKEKEVIFYDEFVEHIKSGCAAYEKELQQAKMLKWNRENQGKLGGCAGGNAKNYGSSSSLASSAASTCSGGAGDQTCTSSSAAAEVILGRGETTRSGSGTGESGNSGEGHCASTASCYAHSNSGSSTASTEADAPEKKFTTHAGQSRRTKRKNQAVELDEICVETVL